MVKYSTEGSKTFAWQCAYTNNVHKQQETYNESEENSFIYH